MESDENILIQQYLAGELSQEGKIAFEARLQTDETLASEVALYRSITASMQEPDIEDLEEKLQVILKSQPEKRSSSKYRTLITRLSIAASILIILTVGWYFTKQGGDVLSNRDLLAEYVDVPAGLIEEDQVRSTGSGVEPTNEITKSWEKIDAYYQQENYTEALQEFTFLRELDPTFQLHSRSRYFYNQGILQMKLGVFSAAEQSFVEVSSNQLITQAKWNRALALLQLEGKQVEAVALFKSIQSDPLFNEEKQKQATEILNQLKRRG